MRTTAILLLAIASAVSGQVRGPVRDTQEITIPVGRLAPITHPIDVDETEYTVLGDGMDAMREYDPDPKVLRLRLLGYTPGVAYVVISSAKGGKLRPLHTIKVTIGTGPSPVPPPPPPGPGPEPVDPLTASIKAAAAADGFTKLADLAIGLTTANSISLSRAQWTVAELSAAWQAAIKSAVGGPTPANLRKVLGDQLNSALPRESAHVMTAEEMVKARELVLRLSKACTEASK